MDQLVPEAAGKWTVAAGIHNSSVLDRTGVKCLSHSLATEGRNKVVADGHAEVLCRRAFIRFLLHQMILAFKNEKSIFTRTPPGSQYPLVLSVPTTTFHMYISQSPCGDASMTSLDETQTEDERSQNESKRRKFLDGSSLMHSRKQTKRIGRRGRNDYSLLGVLRTKPGRSDSEMSCSMSCSDKIAKWGVVGISGALISLFVKEPVYLDSVSVGDLFEKEGLNRALVKRIEGSKVDFPYSKSFLESKHTDKPSPTTSDVCLGWTKGVPHNPLEVLSSNGRKQGHAKRKGEWHEKSESELCNNRLRLLFLELIDAARAADALPACLKDVNLVNATYQEIKLHAKEYNDAKKALLDNETFRGWVVKET
ncbi:adenosine deaminase/editase [Rhizoclosmatium globosum]|uniref:Adenosine deaminase/editase n=1 Tax=Rhizoclosmatium globosum TaxID=329046 RepID=A0A1Y2C2C1_9FUNG|nr:adenosine deaminase/editase [Rhizoclosmatium globosum]|eukprot:ORY41034.1 adenosine deaminase/editase [Rhizoclosmatium globosum]